MGFRHSGETADAALYTIAEREWAGGHNIQVQHEIVGFARFRDDVFVVGRNRSLLHKFLRQYFEKARYFKMICMLLVIFGMNERFYWCGRALNISFSDTKKRLK